MGIYVAITGHGFGHATRTAAMLDTLWQLAPNILPTLVTPTPRWLLAKYLRGPFLYRPRPLDVGVVQADSLSHDLEATQARLGALQASASQVIRAEADFIRTNRLRLVVADMPPLAVAIAQQAGVPCWLVGNFGWDFIYAAYGSAFAPYVSWIADLYSQADRLFRLPLHEPMASCPPPQEVGLTGGEPQQTPTEVREILSLEAARPTVLLTFGGLGLSRVPYQHLAAFPDWQFLTLDPKAPDLPNLWRLSGQTWRPVDLMGVCDQIIAKPGYGTFSEALRLGVPVRCLERQGFAEAAVLQAGLQQYGQHQFLKAAEVLTGPWDWLEAPWQPPTTAQQLPSGGNREVAGAIAQFCQDLEAKD